MRLPKILLSTVFRALLTTPVLSILAESNKALGSHGRGAQRPLSPSERSEGTMLTRASVETY